MKNSKNKIGKRRLLKGNKRENKESECDGVENVRKQSRGGKARQSEKHLGSSSEWDREVTLGVLLRKGHSPKHKGRSRLQRKKRAGFGRNNNISMDKQGMETRRSQDTKRRGRRAIFTDTAAPGTVLGGWDAAASSLIQPQMHSVRLLTHRERLLSSRDSPVLLSFGSAKTARERLYMGSG